MKGLHQHKITIFYNNIALNKISLTNLVYQTLYVTYTCNYY